MSRDLLLDRLYPDHVPDGASMQIVANRPNGTVVPLLWLDEYRDGYQHPFLFRKALKIPAGTTIRGVAKGARMLMIPSTIPATGTR